MVVLASLFMLAGCATLTDKPELRYQPKSWAELRSIQSWRFEGRIVMANDKEAVNASIVWEHNADQDVIDLAGPLAQGHVRIAVMATGVTVDDGDQAQIFEGNPDDVVAAKLGVNVPIQSLKFWVLGGHDVALPVLSQDDGFMQGGWVVKYKAMQMIKGRQLPYKMLVEKDRTRLKLIVDQWNIV